jgi:two-component system nitrate/nitrite response regulator NarP
VTKVLLADDHPMIRTAVDVLLRDSDFEVAGIATTGEETIRAVDALNPDVVMLDLQMPDGTGMDVVRKLRSAGDPRRLIILTAGIDDPSLVEARALGVQGIVLKSSDPAYLIDCLERVCAGGTWVDPELARRLNHVTAAVRRALAPRERQLIRFVRQGLRNREIAQELGVTEGTVKAYLHEVFDKLGVKNRTELAIRAEEFLAASYLGE